MVPPESMAIKVTIQLRLPGAVYVFVRDGNSWSQQAYLKASNTDPIDLFGWSVAIDGDTLVVGAQGEASNARGVNGDQNNNAMQYIGAAYVFTRNGTQWSQQAYLKASNTSVASSAFGYAVAISGDTLVVSANNRMSGRGAVYVFTRSDNTWIQQGYLFASNADFGDIFGQSVAISGDVLAVGAFNEGSSATGVNGDQSDNSRAGSGAVYVFTRNGSVWTQTDYLKASNPGFGDNFGVSVALDGNTLVVGAFHEDSNATGMNGDQSSNSASDAGAVYIFTRDGNSWSQQAYLKASNSGNGDFFGRWVELSGSTLVVGANHEASATTGVNGDQSNNSTPSAGAAYVFTRSGAEWSQQDYIKASNTGSGDRFGKAFDFHDDVLVIGGFLEDSNATGINGNQSSNSAEDAGAAYVFTGLPVTGSFTINAGLNGNWWNGPARSGEGAQIEVADGGGGSLVFVATVYSYDSMGNQIFLVTVGTVNGDTVEVDVFITDGGLWGDNFDPALVNETQWGTGTFTASSCGAIHMSLMPNAQFQGMGYSNLAYDLIRLTTPLVSCPIDD